jgi:RND family efflux transporter MFP subunit
MKTATFLFLMVAPIGALHAVELDARLDWSRRVELTMPVSGVVTSIAAQAGETVKKDQVLLTLDPAPFQAAARAAEARAAATRIERDEATRDAKQAQELYDRTVLSTVELENARNKKARTEAQYQDAQAVLEQARYRLRVSSLRAPFEARILARRAEVGQSLAADLQPPVVMVIAAAGEYLAQARVGGDRAATLKPGQKVEVRAGGKNYPASVRAVNYDPSGKEPYLVDVVFATTDHFQAGQGARIVVP